MKLKSYQNETETLLVFCFAQNFSEIPLEKSRGVKV